MGDWPTAWRDNVLSEYRTVRGLGGAGYQVPTEVPTPVRPASPYLNPSFYEEVVERVPGRNPFVRTPLGDPLNFGKRPWIPTLPGSANWIFRAGRILPYVGIFLTTYELVKEVHELLLPDWDGSYPLPLTPGHGTVIYGPWDYPPEFTNYGEGDALGPAEYVHAGVDAANWNESSVPDPGAVISEMNTYLRSALKDGLGFYISYWEPYEPTFAPGTVRIRAKTTEEYPGTTTWDGATVPGTEIIEVPLERQIAVPLEQPGTTVRTLPYWDEIPQLQPDPFAPPGHRREVGPSLDPVTEPNPLPGLEPWTPPWVDPNVLEPPSTRPGNPEVAPPIVVEVDPGGETVVKPPNSVPPYSDTPPLSRRNEKEKKLRKTGAIWKAIGAINPITEGLDLLYALYAAIPPQYRANMRWSKRKQKWVQIYWPTPTEAAQELWEDFDLIDWNVAVKNVAKNEIEDAVIGGLGQQLKSQSKPLLEQLGRPVGFGTGPAL